jgi:hypothetical protein
MHETPFRWSLVRSRFVFVLVVHCVSIITQLLTVLAAWLTLKYAVRPVRRAFLCSDMDLYRLRPPSNVFPVWLLVVCAIVLPAIVVSRQTSPMCLLSSIAFLDRYLRNGPLALCHSYKWYTNRIQVTYLFSYVEGTRMSWKSLYYHR